MINNIPKTSLNEVQKFQQTFIWADEMNNTKYHAVNWNVVTMPRYLGGLGVRRLEVING